MKTNKSVFAVNVIKHLLFFIIGTLKSFAASYVLAYAAIGYLFIEGNRIILIDPSEFEEMKTGIFILLLICWLVIKMIRLVIERKNIREVKLAGKDALHHEKTSD